MKKTWLLGLFLGAILGVASCGEAPSAKDEGGAAVVTKKSSELRTIFCFLGACTYAPDLLPYAHDVANTYEPAANETVVCSGTNYTGWCEAVSGTVGSYTTDLRPYGWSNPFYIRSVKVGSRTGAQPCTAVNYGGSCFYWDANYRNPNVGYYLSFAVWSW